ncbi:MAG: restriction endonuclease, partial [Methanoregulaceae archaeon]|nr:restriction endonuclease [Methanoregulaceae archaeon]
SVGRPVIQSFSGSLDGHKAKKGIVITTSQLTQDARDYVTKIDKKIVLIDGEYLAQLMIDNNIAVTTEKTYEIKKIDFDYFEEN